MNKNKIDNNVREKLTMERTHICKYQIGRKKEYEVSNELFPLTYLVFGITRYVSGNDSLLQNQLTLNQLSFNSIIVSSLEKTPKGNIVLFYDFQPDR